MAKTTKQYMTRLRAGEDASYLRRPAAYAARDMDHVLGDLEARDLADIRQDLAGIREVLAEAERREASR